MRKTAFYDKAAQEASDDIRDFISCRSDVDNIASTFDGKILDPRQMGADINRAGFYYVRLRGNTPRFTVHCELNGTTLIVKVRSAFGDSFRYLEDRWGHSTIRTIRTTPLSRLSFAVYNAVDDKGRFNYSLFSESLLNKICSLIRRNIKLNKFIYS